jgi:hypothetical protein
MQEIICRRKEGKRKNEGGTATGGAGAAVGAALGAAAARFTIAPATPLRWSLPPQ